MPAPSGLLIPAIQNRRTCKPPQRALKCEAYRAIRTMKTLLSSAAIALAIAATTICAKAECLSVVGLNIGCSPPVDDVAKRKQPQQSHETAPHPAPIDRVAKRPKPEQTDEKAPAVSPPPALPGAVTQNSPVDGLRAGDP